MGKFIEEFYYGNLDPQARSTKHQRKQGRAETNGSLDVK